MSMCWRKSRLLVWLALASLSVALLGAGCGKGTGQGAAGGGPPEVKIGHIHPLTGSMAYEGGLMRSAIQMCVDEINESGGIKSLGGAK
ncbi:MAG: transporter substrate-binding protein, partial [Clostridia bacterium]|nr:transporter substrate-binding protein [Clostridia bacterium]